LLRFDLAAPRGTCYLAEEAVGAFVEAFQDWSGTILPAAEVLTRRISTLFVPDAVRLADCTNPRALAFGVTAEIHSSPDRSLTQLWAVAFAEAGFAGVGFFVRHDPAQQRRGIALFGQAGEASWPIASTSVIAAQLIIDVEARFGIRVQ
jgi:hypothetical protein